MIIDGENYNWNLKIIMGDMGNNCRKFGAIGQVDPQEIKKSNWDILDLSQAIFEIDTDVPDVQGFVCHGRAMAYQPKKTDPLLDLLSSVHTVRVILPKNVSRKQLNAAIKNARIYQIEVTEDCPLFRMKDGDVWNKKGTILIYKQRDPEYVPCGECGKMIVSSDAIVSAEGTILCENCRDKYLFCDSCYRYFRKGNPEGPKEKGGHCREFKK